MKISLIAAVAENGTIGRNNELPWTIKDDMRFFARTTRGHAVVSGRKNFDAMGRPLPKRRNIVVTRKESAQFDGAQTATTIETALRLAEDAGEEEAFIIGGAQIYALAFPYAHSFYRTRVLAAVEGDVQFPSLDLTDWTSEELLRHDADSENEFAFVIERLLRPGPPVDFRDSRGSRAGSSSAGAE